jgi:hypothetical protein
MEDKHLVNAIKYAADRLHALELEAARRDIPPDEAQRKRALPSNPCQRCRGTGVRHPEDTGKQFNCWDCKLVHNSFMVKDPIWKQAFPDYAEQKKKLKEKYKEDKPFLVTIHLCFTCVEKRLGRKLVPSDFNLLLPINYGIVKGMEMTMRALGRDALPNA